MMKRMLQLAVLTAALAAVLNELNDNENQMVQEQTTLFHTPALCDTYSHTIQHPTCWTMMIIGETKPAAVPFSRRTKNSFNALVDRFRAGDITLDSEKENILWTMIKKFMKIGGYVSDGVEILEGYMLEVWVPQTKNRIRKIGRQGSSLINEQMETVCTVGRKMWSKMLRMAHTTVQPNPCSLTPTIPYNPDCSNSTQPQLHPSGAQIDKVMCLPNETICSTSKVIQLTH